MLVLLLEVGFRKFGSGWILGRGVSGVVRDIPLSSFFAFCFFFFYILVAVRMHNTFEMYFGVHWVMLNEVGDLSVSSEWFRDKTARSVSASSE
jgi:hypothetical protein